MTGSTETPHAYGAGGRRPTVAPTVTAVVLSWVLILGGLASSSHAADRPVGRLGVGDSVFWAEARPVSGSEPLTYRLEVLEPGHRLRVALDHSNLRDSWSLRVDGPGGARSAWGFYSMEAWVTPAKPGTYTVVATPRGVQGSTLRLRAKLEPPPANTNKRVLLPNLRIAPPYELTLRGRPWYFGFGGGGSAGPSCFPEETAEHLVTRCLRFSFGPENAGDGSLELIYAAPAEEGGRKVMYQQIHYSDGSTTRREAGTYEYHPAHAHYHHPLIAGQQLFKVANPRTGKLEEAGVAKKTGFCMGDYNLVDWERFYQDRSGTVESSCGLADVPIRETTMGVSTGWADIYSYFLEGNFIDFDDHGDGLYVIRAFTDQSGSIAETNENDNISYAYFEVTGDDVRLIERGYGEDPWDPDKKVLVDPRNFAVTP